MKRSLFHVLERFYGSNILGFPLKFTFLHFGIAIYVAVSQQTDLREKSDKFDGKKASSLNQFHDLFFSKERQFHTLK